MYRELPNDLKIRNSTPLDHPRIIEVLPDWWGGRDLRWMLPKLFLIHFCNTSFVIDKDNEMIAFLIGFLSPSKTDEAYIHFAGVHPDFRGAGIGKYLYDRFFGICRKNDRNTIRACTSPVNKGSIEFHKKIGFKISKGNAEIDGIPDKEITIAEALKVGGYRTGMVGKWHLGDYSHKPEHHPMRHGFDELFGTPMSNDELPNALYRNETMLERDIGLDQARLTGLSTREAVRFVEGNTGNQPFFLYLAPHAPHLPLYASENFKDKSAGGIYGDVVEELDWGVGQVMQCLKDKGLEENTIVIFKSDNGPWYEGHPGQKHRGRKGQSYEGGFQIPMLVRWPMYIPAGSVCKLPAMNIDIFPTLLAAAGLELPNDRVIDGKNILGLLTGEQDQTPHDVFFFYHIHDLEGVRVGDWKYYREISHYVWPVPVDKPNTFLGKIYRDDFLGSWPNLYNLATDPGENYDLASRYPEKCDAMEEIMREWDRDIEHNPGGWL